jgi:DNA-binding transcriptional LysR family regulator
MTFHQLKVFSVVVKLGSITRAGEALELRQPSVTMLIQNLEREFAIKLFDRLGKKIHLTDAGKKLLQYAGEILAKAEMLKDEIDEIKGLEKGKLSVGASFIAGATFIPVAVQEFHEKCTGIEILLKIERSCVLERGLLEGAVDLAILSRAPESPLLIGTPYREEKAVIIASPNHPLTKRRSVSLEALAKEPLISAGRGSFLRNTLEQLFAEKRLPFSMALEIDVERGGREAINGIGPHFMCHVMVDVKVGRLKVLNVPDFKAKRTINITVHKARQSSSLVQGFVSFLERYQSNR